MLDYNKLSDEFTVRLNTYDREKLIEWIEFDANRILFERLLSGETVPLDYDTMDLFVLSDPKEIVEAHIDDFDKMSYELAA